ncbi:MAG: class I SAM-dependent methyltransferase [Ktedonobacteraceae bacterium]
MTVENTLGNFAALNQQTREAWNQNAAFWDEHMGDGNQFQRVLIGPASERLLALQPDELVLEIACGNGVFSRRMASLGAHVIATDFSENMLVQAQKRNTHIQYADRIEYKLIDATNEEQLLSLGRGRFDAAVCNMAIMDMAQIEPMLSALAQLLKANGRFVFSITHPCFNSDGKIALEEEDRDGEIVEVYSIKVAHYLGQRQHRGLGIIGQPVPHYYFERPLHVLFNACFQAGFVMDGLEEPAFGPEDKGTRWFSWATLKEIPPVLVARLRLPR